MKNKILKIKNQLSENKKRAVAWLLVGSLVLGICPMQDFISNAAEAPKTGKILTETNDGDMNIVPYNNDDLIVDLGCGAWGTIAVADVNQDGYMDLLMGNASKPYEGTKVFYGRADSQNSDSDDYLVMDICRRITGNSQLMGSTIYDNDDKGDYIRTLITSSGWQTGDAIQYPGGTTQWNYVVDTWDTQKAKYIEELDLESLGLSWDGMEFTEGKTTRTYTFADYDGDGCLDKIAGLQSEDDYGWYYGHPNFFDKNGLWDPDKDGKEDVLHSWVFWHENPRNAADYEGQDITQTIAIESGEAPAFGDPQVVKVYEYTTDESGNKIIDEDSAKPLDVYGNSQPQFRDWDNDGDLDIICGSFINEITYFENIGDRQNPIYVTGRNLVAFEDGSEIYAEHFFHSVTSAKWNNDEYFDFLMTGEDGRLFLLENTGEKTKDNTPIFKKAQYFKQPADSVKVGMMNTPVSVDWDKDGDEDIITGDSAGFISYVENLSIIKDEHGNNVQVVESLENPSWNKPVRMKTPDGKDYRVIAGEMGSIQGPMEKTLGYTALSVADWDGDGVLDVMSNNVLGAVYWLRGIEGEFYTLDYPRPVEVEWENGPKIPKWYNYDWRKDVDKELITQWRTTPFMIDLPLDRDGDGIAQGDGLIDLVLVDHEGYLSFFERYRATDGSLKLKEGKRIFKNSSGAALRLTADENGSSGRQLFTITDYNDDGKLDLIVDDTINVAYFENATLKNGEYVFKDGETMHSRLIAYHDTCPTTCDWNGDDIPDLLIGAEDGHLYYLKNTYAKTDDEVETPEEEDGLNQHLVAHWDFEGEGDEVYKDKATAGESDDNLTVVQAPQGATAWAIPTIENGIASFELNGGAFQANDSSDLDLTGEMTIFMKIMVRGSTGYELLNKNSSSKPGYCFYAGNPTTFSVGVGNNNSYTWTGDQIDKGADKWREVAFVVGRDQDSGNLTVQGFMSKDVVTGSADDFKALGDKVVLEYSELSTNDLPLTIGTSNSLQWGANVWRYFDDIRIYDTALSTDQLATLLPGPSIDDHLVAHWDFNGEGDTALTDKATVGTANDLTKGGTTTNVSIENGVATIQPGGYLTTPDQADLDQGEEMTIFMRLNPEKAGNLGLMSKASGAHYAIMFTRWADGRLAFEATAQVNNERYFFTEPGALGSGAWRELAVVVRKGENNLLTYEIYVSKDSSTGQGEDFVLVGSKTATSTVQSLNNQPLIIGNNFNNNETAVNCQYDDVRIYNTALTTAELATLMPDYKNLPGLLAQWDFNGEGEAARKDKASNSANADDLTFGGDAGTVNIENGIAKFEGNGYLKAENSDDLNVSGPMTLFVRAKVTRTKMGDTLTGFVDKRSANKRTYALTMWDYDQSYYRLAYEMNINDKQSVTDYTGRLDINEWREIAVVVDRNGQGKLTYEILMSKNEVTVNGNDFVTVASKTTPYEALQTNTAPLIIGNTMDLSASKGIREIDEIRIYNGAMKADEIAQFVTTAEGDDTSYYLQSLENDAYIAFDTNKFTYNAETTKDTFTMTPVTDDAVDLKVDGIQVTSGAEKAYDLEVGLNTFTITVGDGITPYKTYTINITRNEIPTLSVDELQAQIDSAKGIAQGEYTDSSFAELQTVIASAQAVVDDEEATDAERIEAAEILQRAIASLTSEMRYADLKELVTVAGNLQNTGYQKWADYKRWSEKAQAIVSTKAPYLGEVAEVYAGLKNAYDELMSEKSLPAVSLEGFRNVTTWNYVMGGSQMPNTGEYTGYTLYDLTDVDGNRINSLDKVLLSMKVKFAASGGASQLCFAYDGKEFKLYSASDNVLKFVHASDTEDISAEYTSVPHMVNQEFNLQISYEYLDTDGDKTDDALRIGFYLNGKLYKDRHFVVENCDVNNISSVLGAVYSSSAVTISSLVVAEEDHWNLDNGEYQLGDGAVWVNNETSSETTLNTVGDYQIAKIAKNNVVNYAILYKTGDANADNTNDVKDLVASLHARAGEKADTRAAVLGADVNGDEIIDEKDTVDIRAILIE